jgi:hypothetical protein
MKQFMLLPGLLMLCLIGHAQGKYAGAQSKLIGTKYTDSRNIPGLKTWTFRSGSLVSGLDDPETILVDVYKKGKVWIAFFSIKEDTASTEYTIVDVIEVKTLSPGYIVNTGLCRQNEENDATIVATVRWVAEKEFLKPVKQAWKLDRDKRKIIAIPAKNVDCISEGGS